MATVAATLSSLLYGLLVALNRLSATLSPGRKHLHHARFAQLHELASLQAGNAPGDPETSLLLGVGELSRVLRVRPTRTRRELGNLLVVAPTRGGKGLLATSQLLTWQASVVVNDIKGELFAQTAGFRSTLGPVYVIDPTGVGHRYDPLLGKKTEDALLSSATHLLFKADEGEGAIFTQRATVMLTQLFLAAREEGAAPLPYVRQIIRTTARPTRRPRSISSAALAASPALPPPRPPMRVQPPPRGSRSRACRFSRPRRSSSSGMRTSSASTAGCRRFRPNAWIGGALVCWHSGGAYPPLGLQPYRSSKGYRQPHGRGQSSWHLHTSTQIWHCKSRRGWWPRRLAPCGEIVTYVATTYDRGAPT